MYNNIGGKIKLLAAISFAIMAIGSFVGGIAMMATDDDLILPGVFVLILGPVFSWVSTWVLFGFGELIESNEDTKNSVYAIENMLRSYIRNTTGVTPSSTPTPVSSVKSTAPVAPAAPAAAPAAAPTAAPAAAPAAAPTKTTEVPSSFCTQCGAKVIGSFCVRCGTKIEE